jgi:hypothetical protein
MKKVRVFEEVEVILPSHPRHVGRNAIPAMKGIINGRYDGQVGKDEYKKQSRKDKEGNKQPPFSSAV